MLSLQLKTTLQKVERKNSEKKYNKSRKESKEGSFLSNFFDWLQLKPCYAPPISIENPLIKHPVSSYSTNLLVTTTKTNTTPIAINEEKI